MKIGLWVKVKVDGTFTKIAVLDSEIEAGLLESILKERQIPHLLVSYHDTAFDGLFQTQKGWGYVSAPEDWAEEIKAILADVRTPLQDPL